MVQAEAEAKQARDAAQFKAQLEEKEKQMKNEQEKMNKQMA